MLSARQQSLFYVLGESKYIILPAVTKLLDQSLPHPASTLSLQTYHCLHTFWSLDFELGLRNDSAIGMWKDVEYASFKTNIREDS